MILEIRGTKGKKSEVFLEGAFYCRCYPKDLKELNFTDSSEGRQAECSAETLASVEQNLFLPRAKRRALLLLEKKEYTEAELKRKLVTDGYPEGTVGAVLSYVTELHYVNDRAFAERYALYLLPKCSERELLQKLYMKGFDKELIKEAVETAKETYRFEQGMPEEGEAPELVAIRAFLRKKGYRPEVCDNEKRKRLVGALYRKGFSFSHIKEALGELETEEECFLRDF